MFRSSAPPTSPAILESLRREEQGRVRLMLQVRLAALAVVLVWLMLRVAGTALYYYGTIVVLFGALGVIQLFVSRRESSRVRLLWLALIFLDMALLTFAFVVPAPTADAAWPLAMQLRLGSFEYFFVFIAFAVLSYSPGLALWTGLASAAAWSLGVGWVISRPEAFTTTNWRGGVQAQPVDQIVALLLDPNYVSFDIWIQQVLLCVLVAGILSVAVWRGRRLVQRQAAVATERANLARYFSPNMGDELANARHALGQGRSQNAGVLFVDIVGFTAYSESRPPEAVIAFLQSFHSRIATAVFEHGGTVNKYIGDAVMATFGTPESADDDATRTLDCVRSVLETMQAWNDKRAADDRSLVRFGIGAHFGPVVIGDIGEERCLEFAVVGDTVNTASRLEALTRAQNVRALISDALVAAAREEGADMDTLLQGFDKVPPQELRGKREPLTVWPA